MPLSGEPPLGPRAEPLTGAPAAPRLHCLLAEFATPEQLVAAAWRCREEGYRVMDAYTPFPIEELSDILCPARSKVPYIVLAGAVIGGATGYFMQDYTSAVAYPLNIGGRPLHSWPMFIPITFELTILFGGLFALFGMFILNRLPTPYHPVFNAPRFALASRDRYFLAVGASDPAFDREATRAFLLGLSPSEVVDVEP